MNPAITCLALAAAGPACAGEWFCHSPLEAGEPPRSSLEFRLTLAEDGGFEAEGRRADRGFGWNGAYTRFDNQIAMIGATTRAEGPGEARALSRTVEDRVMILSMQEAQARPVMVRCLRHGLR